MPRLETSRSAKSVQGWVFKSDQLAQIYAPFATDASEQSRGASETSARIAVAAKLHTVVGLQAFAHPPQSAIDQEVDDALLLPFI